AIESLIKAGAMDSLPGHRAQLLAALESAMAAAGSTRRERQQGQVSLFGDHEDDTASFTVTLPSVQELNKQEARMMERDLLGVYVSDHPLQEVGRMLRSSTNT